MEFMNNLIPKIFIIFHFSLFLSKEEIINNPIKISDHPNPIIIPLQNQYYILTSGESIVVDKQTGEIQSRADFATYSKPYVFCIDESNQIFIYSQKNLYQLLEGPSYRSISINTRLDYPTSNSYVDYIKETKHDVSDGIIKGKCKIQQNEIVIYGKRGAYLTFTYILAQDSSSISISSDMEDTISCKKTADSEFLCGVIINNEVFIYLIMYLKKLSILHDFCGIENMKKFTLILKTHTEVVLYDTNIPNIKYVCAKNIDTLIVECLRITLEVTAKEELAHYTYSSILYYSTNAFSFQKDSSNNEYCNLKTFNSEFLYCCGGTNLIKCSRLNPNNNELIATFSLDFPGENTDLNVMAVSSNFANLFYMNKLSSQEKIYEYFIYIPECINKAYSIIAFHSINEDKNGNEETINEFFIRRTNTNYYIEFENIPEEYGNFTLNEELIDFNTSRLLINASKSNILDFISTNHQGVNDFEILYTISIDETYSTQCKINLTILPCYKSCDRCTKDNSSSNSEEHNCEENKCKAGYYKDPTKDTNCFMISEKKTNWYFDYNEMEFQICNNSCLTCAGPSNKECLSCYTPEENSEHAYLYNDECLSNCPDGTYKSLQPEGYYKCLPCYVNCKTCTKTGTSINMNCDSCEAKDIFYSKNCYKEYDSNTKSFYKPESSELSSCRELINFYIKENTYECVSSIPSTGYFLSNTVTGIFSPCHEDCKTCSKNYTEDNTNCDICFNQELNYLDGNCIETCPDGYYSYENSNANNKKICKKCYNVCLKCNEGPIYNNLNKLINMNCLICKKDIDPNDSTKLIEKFIQGDGNCFPIITYTTEKIIFNVSEIYEGEERKTCLDYGKSIFYGQYECNEKPTNTFYVLDNEENTGVIEFCDESCNSCHGKKDNITQDTNCIVCSERYFKTEDSNTNCILESLIPENYYKNESDNIYYHCYLDCNKCNNSYDIENNNMNCIECIADYYFLYETNNCYNMNLIENNEYYFSEEDNKFHKCYYSCEKCLKGGNDENHNCTKCKNDYYFEENTNNCYDMTYIEKGYYFDNFTISGDELPIFKKCYENCKTCKKQLIDNEMNCILCKENYYKINGTNNCYDEDLLNNGYYLNNNLFFPCEENCLTCSNSKTIIDERESNNCLSCDQINKGLYLVYDLKNCEPIEYKENGYYLESDPNGLEIFYKCYYSCHLCDKGIEYDFETSQDNHNCLECEENYYKLKNDLNPKNCYGNEMIAKGYTLVRNFWTICHQNCEECSEKPTYNEYRELISQNCLLCYGDMNFIYETSDCGDDSLLENGYFFDDDDSMYHKCNIQCKSCEKNSTEDDPKCLSCNVDGGYYPAFFKPESRCYNKFTIDPEYVLVQIIDQETGKKYKKWTICYQTCRTCLGPGNENENNCANCISKYYLIYNTTNCVTKEYASEHGYYYNNTFGQYVQCDKACITCTAGIVNGNTNCIKCNEEDGYYPIKGKSNSICYNSETVPKGYYLNQFETPYKWDECYENCATCEYKGNSNKMSCLSCRTDIISPIYNKIIYFKLQEGNCIEGCPNDLFLTNSGDCVEVCPNLTYQFSPNTSCVEQCPKNYELDKNKTRCISKIISDDLSPSEFQDIILNDLTNFVDPDTVINGSNFKAQVISSSDLDPIEQIKKGISGLDFGNCINVLKKQYNIPEDEDLIIIEIETKEDKEKNKNLDKNVDCIDLGKNVQVTIFDKTGRQLDMSYCSEDITVMKFVGDLEEVDFDFASEYADQGIDVFNAQDSFFNDICHPFQSDKDIVLGDRREDLYKNVSFCGDNCIYNGINYDLMIANCACDAGHLQTDTPDDEDDEEIRKGVTLNDLANSFTSELLSFNFIVIKCYNLVFSLAILKINIGFFSLISMNGIEIIFLIIFWSKGLKPIKNYMLVFEPFDPRVDPPNPPPKSKKLSYSNALETENANLFDLLNDSENKKNANKKEKEIQKTILINNLLRNRKSIKKETIKHNKNDEDNDDVLVVQYLNNESNKSKDSFYLKTSNENYYEDRNFNSSESESERYKQKLKNSIKHKVICRNNKIINFKDYDENEDQESHSKTSSLGESINKDNKQILINKVINKDNKKMNSYDLNTKDTIEYNRKTKNSDSKKTSKRVLSTFSPKHENMKTIDGVDTPLSINFHKLNKSSLRKLKFLSPAFIVKRKNEIIFEEDENNIDNKNEGVVKFNDFLNNTNNIFETMNMDNKRKKNSNLNNKIVKFHINPKESSQYKSSDIFIPSDEDKYEKNNLRNYLKKHRKIRNRNVDNFNDKNNNVGEQKRSTKNFSSRSVVFINRNDKNKTESNLNESERKKKKNEGNMRLKYKVVSYAFTDEELRNMDFEESLRNDHRTFFRTYLAILTEEHIILNTFFMDVYLELRVIKLSFLIFSLEISFFLNALFYTDQYISDTYHNDGVLDFFSSIPKSLYSFFLTLIVINLLKLLYSSKRQLMRIIKERKTKQKYLELTDAELNRLRKKIGIYFIIVFLFGIFFLYYVSSFCAVYHHSQLFWFYGCLESLAFDMSTPFLFGLILTNLRYWGLRKHIKCLFFTSNFIGNII